MLSAALVESSAEAMRKWGLPAEGDRCEVCTDVIPELVSPKKIGATVAWVDLAKDLLGLKIDGGYDVEVFALGDYLVTWWYEGDQREVLFT